MNSKYYMIIVLLLSLLTFMLLFNDTMKEYFDDEQTGKCMDLYSKSLLKISGINIVTNPGERSYKSCPPILCKYNESDKKCLPVKEHTNNLAIQNYCNKEQYISNISNAELCKKIGYTWKDGICNPSVKRQEDECPVDDLCKWNSEEKECESKIDKTSNDYDSVQDYCSHLKNLSTSVSKETCNKADKILYNYNDLTQKCINVSIDSKNINDKCWGDKTINDCMNMSDSHTQCMWIPVLSKVANANDIVNLRDSELKILDSETNKLDTQLQSYISKVKPYQKKIDEEQAAALIIKLVEEDDKSRYKFETKLKDYKSNYETTLR